MSIILDSLKNLKVKKMNIVARSLNTVVKVWSLSLKSCFRRYSSFCPLFLFSSVGSKALAMIDPVRWIWLIHTRWICLTSWVNRSNSSEQMAHAKKFMPPTHWIFLLTMIFLFDWRVGLGPLGPSLPFAPLLPCFMHLLELNFN